MISARSLIPAYDPFALAEKFKFILNSNDKGFALTQEGKRVTKEYLDRVLQEIETPVRTEGSAVGLS